MRYLLSLFLFLCLAVSAGGDVAAKDKKSKAKKARKPAAALVEGPRLPVLRPITVTYDVYVGGVHFVEADFTFEQKEDQYTIKTHAQTRGFWHWLLPWESEMESRGHVRGARFVPVFHKNANSWKENLKTAEMRFDEKGNVTTSFDPPEKFDDRRTIMTEDEKRGTFDPLSGILQLLGNIAVYQTCTAQEPIFDGARRFDFVALDKGFSKTDPDDYGIYKGMARYCEVGFSLIKGEWKDRERSKFWQYKDGKTGGREPFDIYLARLAPELPELAVRAQTPMVWGDVVVHLSAWRYAD